jgi:hypothetical protein
VRCEYAAPPFVIASHDAAGCDRARTKPRDAAKATARLVNCPPASRGCARFLFSSCFLLLWTAIGSEPTRVGRTRFPWLPYGLRGKRWRQVMPGFLLFSCILQENTGVEWITTRRGSLIAVGGLAMLAAGEAINGAQQAAAEGSYP